MVSITLVVDIYYINGKYYISGDIYYINGKYYISGWYLLH